jgi:transposase
MVQMMYKKISNSEKIKECLKVEKDAETKNKLVSLNLILELKIDINQAASLSGTNPRNIYNWIDDWNEFGLDGLIHGPSSPGRTPRITEEQLAQLKKELEKNEKNYTTQEILLKIKELFDIEYSLDEVRVIARDKLHMNFGKPYPHDYRQPKNAEEILHNRLSEVIKPLLAQGIQESEIAIGLIDEASPQTTSNTVRVWSFDKKIRIVKNTTKFHSNTIGFYALTGNSCSMPLESSKADDMEKFLPVIKENNHNFKAIVAVSDNFSSHKVLAEKAKPLGIYFVFLPPYSPNLNPIELIWKSIKRVISLSFIEAAERLTETIRNNFNKFSQSKRYAGAWIEKFLTPILPKVALSLQTEN